MVDVSAKSATERVAVAEGKVIMRKETLDAVIAGNAAKGDVLGAARLAGIMAAKPNEPPMPTLRQWSAAREQAIGSDDRATIRAVLKDAVPEFGPGAA